MVKCVIHPVITYHSFFVFFLCALCVSDFYSDLTWALPHAVALVCTRCPASGCLLIHHTSCLSYMTSDMKKSLHNSSQAAVTSLISSWFYEPVYITHFKWTWAYLGCIDTDMSTEHHDVLNWLLLSRILMLTTKQKTCTPTVSKTKVSMHP